MLLFIYDIFFTLCNTVRNISNFNSNIPMEYMTESVYNYK